MFDTLVNNRMVVRGRIVIAEQAWWIIILISSVSGLLFLTLSLIHFGEDFLLTRYIKPEALNRFLNSLGIALLSGGVFASILKALQFSRIFQEELSAVIYDTKFLERRTDIEAVWGEVSDILYKRKFPAIKDEIKKAILKTYFPTEVNFYYDKFEQDIQYELHEGSSEYMKVTEIINFTVKSVSKTEEIKLPYSSTTLTPAGDNKTDYDVLEVKINDDPKKVEVDKKRKDDVLEATFLLEMSGSEEYEVFIKNQRILCPDVDNHKTFASSKIVNNVKVDVRFPDDINMRFFSMGTPGEFKDRGSSEHRILKSYRGLIFPRQGYRILLSRRKG